MKLLEYISPIETYSFNQYGNKRKDFVGESVFILGNPHKLNDYIRIEDLSFSNRFENGGVQRNHLRFTINVKERKTDSLLENLIGVSLEMNSEVGLGVLKG